MSVQFVNVAGHTAAISAIVGTFGNLLPPVLATLASLGAVVWYGILIYDRLKKGKTNADAEHGAPH